MVPGGNVATVNLSGEVTGSSSGDTFKFTVTDGYFAETYTAKIGQSGTGWDIDPAEVRCGAIAERRRQPDRP